jgi:hypothetical protein
MKLTKFLMFCIIAIILLSCSEEDPQPTSAGMVGTWSVTAVDYKGTTSVSGSGISAKTDFTGTGKNMHLTVVFKETPNTVVSEGGYTAVLKTTMAGQTSTEEIEVDGFLTNGTWTLSGRTVTFTNPDGTDTATIIEQTATTMKMKWVVNESETDSGITTTEQVTGTYTLTKK